ncbi:MAG TPA: FliH/SctL family protein [Anaeromyxobacteraceae bacterium]|nr:FliH/SctL family protein [Anaeromyxobacteraceae bacterium]
MANIIRALAAPTRRIDGAVHEANLEAERIVGQARAAARELSSAAEEEAARVREEARVAGRREGLSEAGELLVWAAAERDRLLATVEPEVVRLALCVAAKVLGREAEQGGVVAPEVAARALFEARDRAVVAVRVHPVDLDAVREREATLSALVPRASGIAWISDPAVGRGGAVVETETGSIDARLESQLEVVRRVLVGVRS